VTVADLNEAEVRAFAGIFAAALGERLRQWNTSAQGPHQPSTRPRHAFQKTATVDSVIVEVLQSLIDNPSLLVRHFFLASFFRSELITETGRFIPVKF
jgi:hypothetical protein